MSEAPAAQRLRRYSGTIDLCVYCPKLCRHVCPVAVEEARETTTPWGLMSLIGLVRDGLEAPTMDWAETLLHCTGCGRCRDACLHANDIVPAILAGREIALAGDLTPPALAARVAAFADRSNQFAETLVDAFGPPPRHAAVAYVPGCAAIEAGVETVSRSVAILERLGVGSVAVFGRVTPPGACCGDPLRWAGARREFAEHGRWLVEQLADCDMVVVDDPGCADALRSLPDYGVAPALLVETAAEVLMKALEEKLEPVARAGEILLHQPCQTRRAEERTIARQIAELCGFAIRSLPEGDRSSACCGAGGELDLNVPLTAKGLAEHLGREADRARPSPETPLVTSSPRCAAHLRAAGITVQTLWDLVETVLDAESV